MDKNHNSVKTNNNLTAFRQKQIKYWQERAEKTFLAGEKDALKVAKALKANYNRAIKEIQTKINLFYGRFAAENGMSLEEAKKLLDKSELISFKDNIKDILAMGKKENFTDEQMQKYKTLYAKTKISRLQELEANIQYELDKLTNVNNTQIEDLLSNTFEETYLKTNYNMDTFKGFSSSFTNMNPDMVNKAIKTKYQGDNFNTRLYKNESNLMTILTQEIPRGLTLGYNPKKLADLVSKRLDTNYNSTVRLIRTEYSKTTNDATIASYKASGVDKYEILATLDMRTCDDCGVFDGKLIDVNLGETGVNLPPFHPNCRCTTIPYFEPDEFDDLTEEVFNDKSNTMVPLNITYEEWKNSLSTTNVAENIDNNKVNIAYDGNKLAKANNLVIDDLHPASLAGAKLEKEMTFKEADGKRINPNYDKDNSYNTNCQSCVVAYEARRRGYNVKAKPNLYKLTNNISDYTLLNELSEDMTLAYFKKGTLERPTVTKIFAANVKKAYEKLDELVMPGNRYEISIKWKQKDSSHIMCIHKNDNNVLEIYDPQNGEIYTGGSINIWRLNYAEIGRKHKDGTQYPIKLLRVDNLVIDERTANEIMEVI